MDNLLNATLAEKKAAYLSTRAKLQRRTILKSIGLGIYGAVILAAISLAIVFGTPAVFGVATHAIISSVMAIKFTVGSVFGLASITACATAISSVICGVTGYRQIKELDNRVHQDLKDISPDPIEKDRRQAVERQEYASAKIDKMAEKMSKSMGDKGGVFNGDEFKRRVSEDRDYLIKIFTNKDLSEKEFKILFKQTMNEWLRDLTGEAPSITSPNFSDRVLQIAMLGIDIPVKHYRQLRPINDDAREGTENSRSRQSNVNYGSSSGGSFIILNGEGILFIAATVLLVAFEVLTYPIVAAATLGPLYLATRAFEEVTKDHAKVKGVYNITKEYSDHREKFKDQAQVQERVPAQAAAQVIEPQKTTEKKNGTESLEQVKKQEMRKSFTGELRESRGSSRSGSFTQGVRKERAGSQGASSQNIN